MNKIILLSPKGILERYVRKHFFEFSVDDFFQVVKKIEVKPILIKRNEVLRRSSDVLSYMLDIDPRSFVYFDIEAFSLDCINKIANSGVEIFPYYLDEFPVLLKNHDIFLRMLLEYGDVVVEKLDGSQITSEVISVLEKNDLYVPSESDLNKSPLFFDSEIIMSRVIKNNPEFILRLENPSPSLVKIASDCGFVPKKADLLAKPYLRTSDMLLKAFEQDPSVIVFFSPSQFTDWVIRSACSRGFLATEKDLMEYPNLRGCQKIMENAIKSNPALVVYVNRFYVTPDVLIEALSKYKVTKEDIERHPNMAENSFLMSLLPEFCLYDVHLDSSRKVAAMADVLKTTDVLTFENLPFLDARFGGTVNIDDINELLRYLNVPIDETDKDLQQNYLQMLNKIVDASATIRYIQNKSLFEYPDIVALNNSLVRLFAKVLSKGNHDLILKFAKDLHSFIGGSVPVQKLKADLEKYYNIYADCGSLDLSIASDFCNMILNEHMNHFINSERHKILHDIESKLRLTKKREDTILNRKRIKKIEKFIRNKQYDQLGTTEERFLIDVDNVIRAILNNKFVRKKGLQEYKLKIIADHFITCGKIDKDYVSDILDISDDGVSNFIVQKFEQIKVKYLKKINLTGRELTILESERGSLHQTNYIIGDDDRRRKNLSEILVGLDNETLNKILGNKEYFNEISFLLPFVGLVEELDTDTFINMLINYEKIRDKLMKVLDIPEDADFTNIILNNLDDVIFLANGYGSADDITLSALGKDAVSEIGEHSVSKYLDFYIQVLERKNGSIPPVSLQTDDYYLESGMYSDPGRLLIGKIPDKDSCIDLNGAGDETYREVLLEASGDVILVKDMHGNPVSRILLFRRGNVVRMVTSASYFSRNLFTANLFKYLADQIIEQAISNGDNIEYVFVSCFANVFGPRSRDYYLLETDDFMYKFPHIDFQCSGYLLSSRKCVQGYEEGKLDLDFDSDPLVSYPKRRKEISYHPMESEITRLRALKISMETDPVTRENLSRNFEPFYFKEYIEVACGEDWYIAVKKDGTVEKLVLPIDDPRIFQEMNEACLALGIDFKISDTNSLGFSY